MSSVHRSRLVLKTELPCNLGGFTLVYEQPQVDLSSVPAAHRLPLLASPIPTDASESRGCTSLHSSVLRVGAPIDDAEIRPPIVETTSVDVVNLEVSGLEGASRQEAVEGEFDSLASRSSDAPNDVAAAREVPRPVVHHQIEESSVDESDRGDRAVSSAKRNLGSILVHVDPLTRIDQSRGRSSAARLVHYRELTL